MTNTDAQDVWAAIAAYYDASHVTDRILDYCGANGRGSMTAWRIGGYGGRRRLGHEDGAPVLHDISALDELLRDGADVTRSLADHRGTLVQLDVDYYSDSQSPGDAYRQPELVFQRLEPLYRTVLEVYGRYGLKPLVLATGRGYHFTFRVPFGTPLHADLVSVGNPCESLQSRYRAMAAHTERAVLMGWGHDGAGRVLEFLGHEIVRRATARTEVPITLADVPPPGGGAFACLDLSAYGDPLFERQARCAFSSNQKSGALGIAADWPFALTLPRSPYDAAPLFSARMNVERAAALAATADVRIPDATSAPGLIADYQRSAIGRFHKEFDSGPQMDSSAWIHTYDELHAQEWPACVAVPLLYPNPSLLRPVYLRTVALVLWGLGWHPRSIAGLVRSKYERDHGWGAMWYRYDAAARAEFYVRLFCGAMACGIESSEAFTCESQERRGVCDPARCNDLFRETFQWAVRRLGQSSAIAL